MTVIRHAKRRPAANPWRAELIASKPTKVAAVAPANELARLVWTLLRDGVPSKSSLLGSLAMNDRGTSPNPQVVPFYTATPVLIAPPLTLAFLKKMEQCSSILVATITFARFQRAPAVTFG